MAAAVALLAAAGVVVGLTLLVLRNTLAVVAALVCLSVSGYAAWLAATRRGAVRLAAGAGAVGALVGGTATLVAAGALHELLLVALPAAVYTAASPAALRRTVRREPRPARRGSGHGERMILLINPRSGDGVAARVRLADEAVRRGIEPIVLAPEDDLDAVASEAAQRADVIGMAGGDGSQALVAGVAGEHGVPFVCIPAGTRNHFALDLGIDRTHPLRALDAYTEGVDRAVDLARINGRTFVNNVSLGVYADIVKSKDYRGAKLRTANAMLPDLLGPDAPPLPIEVTAPDGKRLRNVRIVLVSNNPYHLDGVVGVGVRPHLDAGVLGVLAVEIRDASDAAALLSLDAVGQAKRYQGWHQWTAVELVVPAREPVAAGVDGESLALDAPLRFEILPGALKARVVPWSDESGTPASSRIITRDALANLWEVASGAH